MGRFLIEDLRGVAGRTTDLSTLSAMIVKLILGSSQIEANVFDSNDKRGTYVVVLQGTLDPGEWVPDEPCPSPEPPAGHPAEAAPDADGCHIADESHPACPPLPPEDGDG